MAMSPTSARLRMGSFLRHSSRRRDTCGARGSVLSLAEPPRGSVHAWCEAHRHAQAAAAQRRDVRVLREVCHEPHAETAVASPDRAAHEPACEVPHDDVQSIALDGCIDRQPGMALGAATVLDARRARLADGEADVLSCIGAWSATDGSRSSSPRAGRRRLSDETSVRCARWVTSLMPRPRLPPLIGPRTSPPAKSRTTTCRASPSTVASSASLGWPSAPRLCSTQAVHASLTARRMSPAASPWISRCSQRPVIARRAVPTFAGTAGRSRLRVGGTPGYPRCAVRESRTTRSRHTGRGARSAA